MSYKRILTIQDISCVGQCSLTVALPILSAAGLETAILPSAVLSTHTAGFSGYTFRDLTDDMPSIRDHWVKEGIKFEAVYTGYLGSTQQIDYVKDIFDATGDEGSFFIVDPAMADHGSLYPGFDGQFVEAMKTLCAKADYILPNITEACFLTGMEYKTEYDREYIDEILRKLTDLGCKNIIFTGISYEEGKTGVVVYENGEYAYYEHDFLPNSCHGTGDIYASSFVGALVRGKSAYDAAKIAADYTVECIKETAKLDNHWYGAAFEPVLGKLIEMLS
ncbi:MAG: pyridoxamine kinase [Anaerofustis stercorihominis]|nr:pyridoxamine kinase [Anaerofustis stercorihominis]